MKKLLIAAVAAPVLLGSLPKAAPAAEPGVLLAQYHDGDAQRHEEWERHREREAERAARWDSFFRARMHEHRERDGYNWASLPMPEKERVIRDEWERVAGGVDPSLRCASLFRPARRAAVFGMRG